jgi:hypothetical protein
MLWVICSVAWADEHFIPLDGSDTRLKASDFGYQINKFTDGGRVHLWFTLNEETARSFREARLRLAKGGKTVVETTVGFADTLWSGKIQCWYQGKTSDVDPRSASH